MIPYEERTCENCVYHCYTYDGNDEYLDICVQYHDVNHGDAIDVITVIDEPCDGFEASDEYARSLRRWGVRP